ncbi:MAG: hypothetical protein KDM81_12580 [Verrucomicrobiae bacterium]|nr:hypothetical protein [Verrucomicrobiae bacterium]MCP5521430.1 hypothetical protein [Verrucomicrobiales bacterium]
MNWQQAQGNGRSPGETVLVAQFGEARLVRHINGTLRLRGGSEEDRDEARHWIVRFLRQPAPPQPQAA